MPSSRRDVTTLALRQDRLRHGAFHGPTALEPVVDDGTSAMKFTTPLGHGLGASIPSDQPVASRVCGLLLAGGPSAVARTVGAVVVNAVQGVVRRGARTHVAQERGKVGPLWADDDATAAVTGPTAGARILASCVHSLPSHVLSGDGSLIHVSLRQRSAHQATTRLRQTAPQVARHHFPFSSAVATAKPFGSFGRISNNRDDRPVVESLPCEVNASHSTSVCHCYAMSASTGRVVA
jgi:hypothetical protein